MSCVQHYIFFQLIFLLCHYYLLLFCAICVYKFVFFFEISNGTFIPWIKTVEFFRILFFDKLNIYHHFCVIFCFEYINNIAEEKNTILCSLSHCLIVIIKIVPNTMNIVMKKVHHNGGYWSQVSITNLHVEFLPLTSWGVIMRKLPRSHANWPQIIRDF